MADHRLAEAADPEPLPDLRLLRRLSLDLRGTLPGLEEYEAVAEDPAALEELRDDWLERAELEEVLVHRLAERWHTRVDGFDIEASEYGLGDEQAWAYHRAVGEEPLRLVARIVVEDRPWAEVVRADHTLANPLLEQIWPLEREAGEGWTEARYTDDRPHAGVLSTNGLWWRYTTDVSNMNRRRVAALSRLLVCEDPLTRPVALDGAALEDIETAVHTQPACQTCHASLDPAASALFGFWWVVHYSEPEESRYHPERERLGEDYLGVRPAWHGRPVSGLVELGEAIAEDPRFDRCAAETFAELYWRRPLEVSDEPSLAELVRALEEGDQRIKPLLRAITDHPEYRSAERAHLLQPHQLASAVEELTGFRWTWQDVDLLDADPEGYRVLAGGVDGILSTNPQGAPGLTRSLVVQRLAEMAAVHAAEDTQAVDELTLRAYGEVLDDEELALYEALVDEVTADSGGREARIALFTAVLRDPAFVSY